MLRARLVMNTIIADPNAPAPAERCSIVVLYDDDATRTRALAACDYLVGQFWESVELNFHWWRTDFLSDPAMAEMAAGDSVAADFLIVCSGTEQRLAPALEQWFEIWLERRINRLGALLDLGTIRGAQNIPSLPGREQFLRDVCRRGNFDYLTAFGETAGARSDAKVGGVIDDILGESRPPTHYGLNE
jgi:hypothetical protein